jgi:hypothetical protein
MANHRRFPFPKIRVRSRDKGMEEPIPTPIVYRVPEQNLTVLMEPSSVYNAAPQR